MTLSKIALSLALIGCAGSCHALASAEAVQMSCAEQMRLGICLAIPSEPVAGQTITIGGVGKVSANAYYQYAKLYNPLIPADPAMCNLAYNKLMTEPVGEMSLVARALWEPQEPVQNKEPVSVVSAALSLSSLVLASVGLLVGVIVVIRKRRQPLVVA